MVEIEVFSTVGNRGTLPQFCGVLGVKCDMGKSAATAEERAGTGVKDVVKMVAFCVLPFWAVQPSCGPRNRFDIICADKGR